MYKCLFLASAHLHSRKFKAFSLMLLTLALIFASIPSAPAEAAAGALDPTFGSGGKVVTNLGGGADIANAVAVQADGKIIAGGTFNNIDFALIRYRPDGSFDPTFGTDGIVTTDFGTGLESIRALALQPDGKIVAGGSANSPGGGPDDFALLRYNANGSLDTSFGMGGKVMTDWLGSSDQIAALAIQTDGRIVVAGTISNANGQPFFALARYDSTGNLDPSFGISGKVLGINGLCSALALQADGKIVVAGLGVGFAVVRYNTDGSLDGGFGVHNTDQTGIAHSLVIQPDGKIIVGGEAFTGTFPNSQADFGLLRYEPSGLLDSTFGVGGRVFTDFFGQTDIIQSVALEPDGKIVAGGFALRNNDNSDTTEFALARYNSNGSLDSAFGLGGKVTTDFFGFRDEARALAIQPDGRIIAAGLTQTTSEIFSMDFALARYGDTGFDLCIQDDSNGNLLQINTTTGDYQFTNCTGLTIGGTGILTKRGGLITLQHNAIDRRVKATIDTSTSRATASVQLLSQGQIFSITDRNITNDTCSCK